MATTLNLLRYQSTSSLQDLGKKTRQVADLLEGLLDLLRVDRASDVTVPNRLLLVIQLDQLQLLQL